MPLTKLFDSLRDGAGFHVVNLGCKVNRVESDTVASALSSFGARCVPECDAAVIVVNTCTVTGEADKKARKAVRHALSASPHALVIVTGCAVAIDESVYRSMSDRVLIVQRAELLASLSDAAEEGRRLRLGAQFRTRVPLKVQDGCNRACTYCIVHVARGPAWSVPAEEVLAEAEAYFERGAKELVLTGIDLGSYWSGVMGLSQLVGELVARADKHAQGGEPPARVRASSLEPHSIDDDFIRLLETSEGRLCRHVHLPLQSGSSKVLREMARPYSANAFVELVGELYRRVPGMSITTDIICGFPGETDDDFEQTLSVARQCRFSKIHVFPYSRREGTPAAARSDQVPPEVKADRCARLRALSDELRAGDLLRRRGTRELAVVEGETALTESYHEVNAPTGATQGSIVSMTL